MPFNKMLILGKVLKIIICPNSVFKIEFKFIRLIINNRLSREKRWKLWAHKLTFVHQTTNPIYGIKLYLILFCFHLLVMQLRFSFEMVRILNIKLNVLASISSSRSIFEQRIEKESTKQFCLSDFTRLESLNTI